MNMQSPVEKGPVESSLKINGRLMRKKDFLPRFQSLCNSFGFDQMDITDHTDFCRAGETDTCLKLGEKDAVVMLSCKISYNPGWGVMHGHPQCRVQPPQGDGEPSFSQLIDPFLRLYKLAQNQIFLTQTDQGEYLISVPTAFLNDVASQKKCGLLVHLEKIAAPGEDGKIAPVATCGNRLSFVISPDLQNALQSQNFVWAKKRRICIEEYLAANLFDFVCKKEHPVWQNPNFKLLYPHLSQLVTHKTPNLRAAEIYLQQQYQKTIEMFAAERDTCRHNLACVTGLVIDMSSAPGHAEQYFVPWKAYIEKADADSYRKCTLSQDDLFVRLMH